VASPVPWSEWTFAFAVYNKAVIKAIKDPDVYRYVQTLPGKSNILRIPLNAVVLPKLRQMLAAKPGVETPDEIARMIVQAVESVSPSELQDAVTMIYKKLFGTEPPPEVLDAVTRAFQELRAKLPEYVQKALHEVLQKYRVAA